MYELTTNLDPYIIVSENNLYIIYNALIDSVFRMDTLSDVDIYVTHKSNNIMVSALIGDFHHDIQFAETDFGKTLQYSSFYNKLTTIDKLLRRHKPVIYENEAKAVHQKLIKTHARYGTVDKELLQARKTLHRKS